jgi:uncharacterized protein involved in outer membrane biogenesis
MRSSLIARLSLGLLLLLIAAAGLVAWLNFGGLRSQIELRAAAVLGRPVSVAGPITWTLLTGGPGIVLRELRVASPPGFSASELVEIDSLQLRLSLEALWRGEVRVEEVALEGVRVHLEVNASGAVNWSLPAASQGGGARLNPAAVPAKIDLERARIDYLDAVDGGRRTAEIRQLQLTGAGRGELSLTGEAMLEATPVAVDLQTVDPTTLFSGVGPWPLTGSVEVAGTSAKLDLEVHPRVPRWELAGSLRIDDADFLAALQVAPRVREATAALLGTGSEPAAGPVHPAPAPSEARLGLSKPLPLNALKVLDTDLAVAFRRVALAGLELRDVNLHSRVQDGVVHMQGRASAGEGELQASLRLQAVQAELQTRLEVRGKDLRLATRRQDDNLLVEASHLELRAQGSGKTAEELLGGLVVDLEVTQPAVVPSPDSTPPGSRYGIEAIKLGGGSKGSDVSITGSYAGEPYLIGLHGPSLQEIVAQGGGVDAALKLTGRLEVAEARLTLDGELRRPFDEPSLQARAVLEGRRMAGLGKLLGWPLPNLARYRVEAEIGLRPSADRGYEVKMDGLQAQLGDSRLRGKLHLVAAAPKASSGPLTYSVKGALQASHLQLDEWRDLKGGSGQDSREGEFTLPEQLALDLSLTVEQLAGLPVSVNRASGRLLLAARQLELEPVQLRVDQAALEGRFGIDARSTVPSLDFELRTGALSNRQIESLVSTAGGLDFDAEAVRISGHGSGRNADAWLRNLQLEGRARRLSLGFGGGSKTSRQRLELTDLRLVRSKAEPLRLTSRGVYDGLPFTLEATGLPMPAAASGSSADKRQAVEISVQAKDLSLNVHLPATETPMGERLKLGFDLRADKLPSAWRPPIPLPAPYRLSGRFARLPDEFKLHDLQARFGNNDLQGSLTVRTVDPRNKLEARLESKRLDLSELAASIGSSRRPGKDEQHWLLPDFSLVFELPRDWDADLRWEGERVLLGEEQYRDAELDARWQAGKLAISSLRLVAADGGKVTARGELDLGQSPPRAAFSADLRQWDLGWVWVEDTEGGKVRWPVDISANLQGRGATAHRFLAAADGNIGLDAGSLRVDLGLIRLWTTRLFGLMLTGFGRDPGGEGGLGCIVGDARVEQGVMHSDAFLLDTDDAFIVGSGELNLGNERLKVRLVPKLKSRSVFNTAVPVDVRGTLSEPRFLPAPEGAVWAAGKTYLSIINPLFLLGNYALSGSREKDPCSAFREQLRKRATGEDAGSGERPFGSQGLEGLLDDVTGSVRGLVP